MYITVVIIAMSKDAKFFGAFGAERGKKNNFEIIFFSFSSHKKSGCYGDTQKM